MPGEWKCRHKQLSRDVDFNFDQFFHACDHHGLPCACGLGFPIPQHAARHLFFEESEDWPHGVVTIQSLSKVFTATRPTRSPGGKPGQYRPMAASALRSTIPGPGKNLPTGSTSLIFFDRTSGKRKADRSNSQSLLARMLKSHKEQSIDTLIIERGHAATRRYPSVLGTPGYPDYI